MKRKTYIDITKISNIFYEGFNNPSDIYNRDIYDPVYFPNLMNPFEEAVWFIKDILVCKNANVYFVSKTEKIEEVYKTHYWMFMGMVDFDFLVCETIIDCNKNGVGINTENIKINVFDTKITRQFLASGEKETLDTLVSDLSPLKAVLHAVNLLHCKNIELVDEPLTRQQRRLKERKARTIYKVLAIKEGDKSYRYLDHGHDGSKKALHLCRGHFRTYTDDAPLFGRVTGTFWIPAHVKGNKQYGEVVKDYKVIPATGN